MSVNKGDILTGTGSNDQFGVVAHGSDGALFQWDSTQTYGVGNTTVLKDGSAVNSVNYLSRLLISSAGNTNLNWATDGLVDASTANFKSKGLQVKEGSNAKQGVATLVAGSAVVANTSVTASSRIFLTAQSAGGVVGYIYVSARTAGTSFTITSASVLDTSTVAYQIFEAA